ncbi:MAG: sigma-70 family RNA polymerase sigma factor [Treponema sp.]|jgi:RNA polymerase sigma factor (sigma-70 family)|nr:sigma-70 family RNA polymerase sigma factor [Treponema sp.]
MNNSGNEIVKYIEPVLHFCVKRLNNRQDAEDLAGEIMVHVLNGVRKYHIESLEKWIWSIAHNRYARFINKKNKINEVQFEKDYADIEDVYDFIDKLIISSEYQKIFTALHTLSCEYRDILVDYYIEELAVKQIAAKYKLNETAVKWRLNIGRKKIKTEIGEKSMDRIYKKIDWNVSGNGGSWAREKYLETQVERAICEAAYEKPLTVEEINKKTGLPAMYIEDELPELINSDAIVKDGKKYAANFIILRLRDKKEMIKKFTPLVNDIADYYSQLFNKHEDDVSNAGFYGSQFTMKRLGFIALCAALREKISKTKEELNMKDGPYPLRADGGYGWFIVNEKSESYDETGTGLYISAKMNALKDEKDFIYCFTIGKYFNWEIYHNGGIEWIYDNKIIEKSDNGIIKDSVLTEDDRIRLIKKNLIFKDGGNFKFNFPVFKRDQYDRFMKYFCRPDTGLNKMLSELITSIHKSFKSFVPKRLDSQINQWVSVYAENITGLAAEELIKRGVLNKPDSEKPMTGGVFCVKGDVLFI